MRARRNANPAALVSHTEKKRRRFYINRKSCTAMIVSAALLFTSVDCITVRAEELADIVPPVSEGETLENPDVPGDGDNTQEGPSYVKNEEGAIIITSFEELSEEESHIALEERKSLAEVTKDMPAELKANVEAYVSEVQSDAGDDQSGEGDDQSGEGNDRPGEGEDQPGEGDDQPGEGDDQSGEGNDQPGEGDDQPGEGGDQPGTGDDHPDEGDDQPGEGDDQPGTGDQPGEGDDQPDTEDKPGEGDDQPGESGDQPGQDDGGSGEGNGSTDDGGGNGQSDADDGQSGAIDVSAAGIKGVYTVDESHRWRLLVAADEDTYNIVDEDYNEDKGTGDDGNGAGTGDDGNGAGTGEGGDGSNGAGTGEGGDGGNGAGTGEGGDGGNGAGTGESGDGSNGAGTGEGGDGGNGAGTGEGGDDSNGAGTGDDGDGSDGADDGDRPTQPETVSVPVTWECADYENEELNEYTFYPKWDSEVWFYDEKAEGAFVPTITVSYAETEVTELVSTEEELEAAFAAGLKKIALNNDIALTKPLVLPAGVIINLDGGGHKLTRGGAEGESSAFLGTMIDMNGEDYTRDLYGTLTLTNITVDGTVPGDRAAAPAIIDWGVLTLGEGAVVTANYNYGTSGNDETDGGRIPEYGGGICVYRELILRDYGQVSVTGNYADLLGGGVYLEREAELWLYGDVIKDNKVKEPESEHGLDLFARPYSKIHYNKDVFGDIRNWPTFYLSKGVILLPIGEDEEIPEPEEGHGKEIYIAASKDSGYSAAELLELKQKLQELGYKVISNQRTEIDTTDLRNWNVYDHYDMGLWTGGTGVNPSAGWSDAYKEYRNRPYYACSESFYTNNSSNPPATTIAEWLAAVENGYYKYSDDGVLSLARYREHIYSREEGGKAAMTFVGYGSPAYKDFCYIDPHSGGEKVVSFDVDSSKVITHTLDGTGFLINAGEENGCIKGYLIYYTYLGEGSSGTNAKATRLYLYRINDGVAVSALHHTSGYVSSNMSLISSQVVSSWDTHMSIKIKVTPDEVKVWQRPQTGEEIDESTEPFFSYALEDTGYSGYGPFVGYGSHNCPRASSFTYSNLYMYFTDPTEEERDMMSPLAEADFTQADTQKYFVNLFGADELEYGDDDFRQYQGYLQMMQEEGIAMITDRNAPFEEYLGSADDPQGEHDPGNLKELAGGGPGNKLGIDDLVKQIDEYLSGRKSTSLKETVGRVLTPAEPGQSVGNIWLKSGEGQFRDLDWDKFDGTECTVQIMDDISCYNKDGVSVLYEILRPGKSGYITLGEGKQPTFQIKKNRAAWPEGPYTVRQTIMEDGVKCAIKGYAYFNLVYPPQYVDPVTYPVTVKVTARVDDGEWQEHGKVYMLLPEGGGALIGLSAVPEGKYTVCEVIELAEDGTLKEGADTGILVEAVNADTAGTVKEVTLDYYTVTFYDELSDGERYGDDTDQAQQIVLNGGKAVLPSVPEKEKFSFVGWVTDNGTADGQAFDFDQTAISGPTKIYAKWEKIEEPRYKVEIRARKDGGDWNDADRKFALMPEGEEQLIFDLDQVKNGTYRIYDKTGASAAAYGARTVSADVDVKVDDGDTGLTVKVENKDAAETVNYYTVTFYDGKTAYGIDTPQSPMIVLRGKKAAEPETQPDKSGHRFVGWMTEQGGSTAFDFEQPVENKTDIYAGWKAVSHTKGDSTHGGEGGDGEPDGGSPEETGDTQTVVVVKDAAPQAGNTTVSDGTAPGGKEPKTGDPTPVEIYATVAMVAGLTYLLLYFMEEGRGMTKREKEVFVAAFIRWAKKGGRFRKCCAIVAIFCLLVYYHSIGKRARGREVRREYLKQV